MILPVEEKVIVGSLAPPKKPPTAEERIEFTNEQPAPTGRQRSCDIIRGIPGVARGARNAKSPKEGFDLFITPEMVDLIVYYMNLRIRDTLEKCQEQVEDSNKYPHLKELDSVELYAFIGLNYYRGLYNLNCHNIKILFSDDKGFPIFGATMSRLRYAFISAHLCFDDFQSRQERWQGDRFTAFREIFEKCNENFAKAMVPSDYLTIDETLYPMRTQVSFKQYNPDKPAKYGMLFKSINSARYPYTYQTLVYHGKPVGEPSTYYVSSTDNYTKHLVDKILERQPLKGRNISMDRLYTSIPICRWLLEKDITMIGTFQTNQRGIPPEMKDIKTREPFSSETYWEKGGEMALSSYVVKTSTGKKNILMLTTVRPLLGVTSDDDKCKPALYKLYDFTKGGTDIVDQTFGNYTVKTKSRKWTSVAFSYVLDTARINAGTVVALNNNICPKKMDSFNFGFELARAFVLPHINRRSRNGLTTPILRKIEIVTGVAEQEKVHEPLQARYPALSESKDVCALCLETTKGKSQKSKKDKLYDLKSQCQSCATALCCNHLRHFCVDCLSKASLDIAS